MEVSQKRRAYSLDTWTPGGTPRGTRQSKLQALPAIYSGSRPAGWGTQHGLVRVGFLRDIGGGGGGFLRDIGGGGFLRDIGGGGGVMCGVVY
jgi:hypothetical protein